MALSSIVKKLCPIEDCGKVAVEVSRITFADYKLITLECGHVTSEEILAETDYESIVSSDGRKLMNFQVEGVKFAEANNARVLIADEQGLGKTIQALALLKLHNQLLTPCVIVTKTTIKHQWHHEIIRWCGREGFLTQVIHSSKELASSAFDIYIVTYDLLKTEHMFDDVAIKTVIIDECQAIKNHLADRSKAVQKISKTAEHIIALSGTPIKNNAGEYFTILNILQPSRFPTYQGFLDRFCDHYWNGYGPKVGGLSHPKEFKAITEDFVIRRTKLEVLPDLPELERKFYHVELDRKLNKAYANALKELDDLYYAVETGETMTSMIAIMSKLRRITGISKVIECVDFITEFLLSNDRKIVIFVHHHAVAHLLKSSIDTWLSDGGLKPSLSLSSELSGDERSAMVDKFKNEDYRVMIASTLAAGEGLNLQFCSDAVVLERQWNPANEEQAEGRFHRIGQSNRVAVTYMIASETIDEYFTELVEQKRAIVASTLDNREIAWDQTSLMRELAGVLVAKGGKKWSL